MSVIVDARSALGIVRPWWLVRSALLVALLVAELLAMSFRFDTGILTGREQGWARLLGQSNHLLDLAIVTAVGVLLCSGARLREELVRQAVLLEGSRRWWAYLAGHLAALGVFTALTALLLSGGSRSIDSAEVWLGAWVVAGVATLALWGAAVLPPQVWLRLGRSGVGALLAGAAVGVLAWGAGRLVRVLWLPLSQWTFWMVDRLLRLVCPEIVCQPARFLIGTPVFRVRIAPTCSGYEGIGLIWVFLGAYIWMYRGELRFPRVLLLVPIGTAVIWLSNSVRIAALIVIGTYGSRSVALGGFHSQAGWLAFNAVGLGLVALAHRTRLFRVAEALPATEDCGPNPAAAYLAPLMALIGTLMITAAFSVSSGFDRWYPLRILAAAVVLWHYRGEYPDLRWGGSWRGFGPALAIGCVVFALWMALEPAHSPGVSQALVAGLEQFRTGWAAAWLGFRVAGSVVVVPLAEELAFRGFLIRRLIAAEFTDVAPGRFSWTSFLISSALFGALHGRWLAGMLAGLLYALALYRRRELADAVVAHATTNALIAAYVLATGSWSLWA